MTCLKLVISIIALTLLKNHHVCEILCILLHIVIIIGVHFVIFVTSVYFSIFKKDICLFMKRNKVVIKI
jgi:hypothetical protein